MSNKKFVLSVLTALVLALTLMGAVVYIVDPFFHYHKPLDFLSYSLYDEIYQNDGILRHFDYDAVIIGSSMTENFKTSEFDYLFSVNSVKTPVSGYAPREFSNQLKRAFSYNPDIKKVIICFDGSWILTNKDHERDGLPKYLYNSFFPDDVAYLYNMDVLVDHVFPVIRNTLAGKESDFDFDEYTNWMEYYDYGRRATLATYNRDEYPPSEQRPFDDVRRQNISDNVSENLVDIIVSHPDTEFYIFFSPYSTVWFDRETRLGSFVQYTEGMRCATQLLLGCENVKLYTFFDNYDLITNLDLYKDPIHYIESVNSDILHWMYNGDYILTEDNFNQRYDEIIAFYRDYDYDSIFE